MGERLSALLGRHRERPEDVRRSLEHPVLVWVLAPPVKVKLEGDLVWKTGPAIQLKRAGDDPLFYVLRKGPRKNNAFGLGVTLGRTNNNDLEIDDDSVSRFHAWFQVDPQSGVWHVADAESSNGTWCGAERLPPGRPAPLSDGVKVKVGDVELTFMAAPSFHGWLQRKAREL